VARLLMLLGLIVGDSLAINLACVLVYRWSLHADASRQAAFEAAAAPTWKVFLLVLNLVFATTFAASGLYTLKRGVSRVDEAFRAAVAVTLGTFVTVVINALLPQLGSDDLPLNETVLVAGWAASVLGVGLGRIWTRTWIAMLRRHGIDTRRVLIVGARAPGREINARIQRGPELGYHVQGFLSDHAPVGSLVDGVPVLGRTTSLSRVVRVIGADEVIIALSGRTPDEVLDVVSLAEDEAVEIQVYPDVFHLITNNGVSIGDVSGLPLIPVKNVALDNPLNRGLKRLLDIVFAVVALTLASPLMLLIALMIRIGSSGPIFFVQQRVGLDNRPFPTIKFRTMRVGADQIGDWTVRDDPRATRIGRFLRRYSLDELPQFINVIRGEMSVVGPRPEQPQFVERFSQSIPRYMRRHKQKAGITGWAQVNGLRGDTSIEDRTRYDLYYVENWSLLLDIKIIIKTAMDILLGRNRGA
jgi:exopolysaccharide biosynthesis polyprenyl glycosylphosphotransferase